MKLIYISQPMKNRSEEDILIERRNAMADISIRLEGEKFRVLDSFFEPPSDISRTNIEVSILGDCVKAMSKADVVYFCQGWEQSTNCTVEHIVTELYQLRVMHYDDEYNIKGLGELMKDRMNVTDGEKKYLNQIER